jgi:hypothetical protein
MKTQVEFRSDKFPPYDGEQAEINPDCWGRRLAEYLKDKLAELNIVTGDLVAEDWGYVLPIQNESFKVFIGCGHQSGADDAFLCFIEPNKPFIRKLFKKIDTTQDVGNVVESLARILSSDPDIHDVRWSDNDKM